MAYRHRSSLLTIATLLLMLSSVGEGVRCPPTLKNIVVNEGQVNIPIEIPALDMVKGVKMMITPTMNELDVFEITNADQKINPDLSGDFNIDPKGFKILNATTYGNGHPINTAGLYFAKCADNSETYGFKVLVIREGPTCSKKPGSSSKNTIDLSCSVTYADSVYHPMPAIMTWYRKDKPIGTDMPTRTYLDPYVYIALSTITVHDDNQDYHCELTFGETTDRQDPNIATNAPDYKSRCST